MVTAATFAGDGYSFASSSWSPPRVAPLLMTAAAVHPACRFPAGTMTSMWLLQSSRRSASAAPPRARTDGGDTPKNAESLSPALSHLTSLSLPCAGIFTSPRLLLSSPSPAPPDAPKQSSAPARAPGHLPAGSSGALPALADVPSAIGKGLVRATQATGRGLVVVGKWTAGALRTLVTDPARARAKTAELWVDIKHELHHYWVGSKLLVAETRTSASLVRKVGRGEALTRRERLQLKRTMGDLLRMVPFIVLVIVPFAEFSLPVLLKLFPNMLPSQFEKPEYRQQVLKKSLTVRLEIHGILQEVLADRVEAAGKGADAPTVTSLMQQLNDVRAGKALPSEAVLKVAALFKDELAIDNMPHGQLVSLAVYSGLSPFGTDRMLRAQLAAKFKALKDDDRDLALEGTAGLSKAELTDACEARGMRAVGLEADAYRRQLDGWLDLSIRQNVPIAILMLSRAFVIANEPAAATAEAAATAAATASGAEPAEAAAAGAAAAAAASATVIQQTLSSLDPHVVAEVVLAQGTDSTAVAAAKPAAAASGAPAAPAAATAGTSSSADSGSAAAGAAAAAASPAPSSSASATDVLTLKLESLEFQNSLIKAEAEAKESLEASEAAAAVASARAKEVEAARADPARAAELAKLAVAAEEAAAFAVERARLADTKKTTVLRMRSQDAARVAAEPLKSSRGGAAAAAAKAAAAAATAEADANEQSLLEALAAGTSLARERSLLAKLKAVQAQIDSADTLLLSRGAGKEGGAASAAAAPAAAIPGTAAGASAGASAGAGAAAAPAAASAASADTKLNSYLRETLNSMAKDLEKEMDAARLATALSKADTDKDGQVTHAELVGALRGLLKGVKTEEAAAALIKRLDADKDGQVTVQELERFLDGVATRLGPGAGGAAEKK